MMGDERWSELVVNGQPYELYVIQLYLFKPCSHCCVKSSSLVKFDKARYPKLLLKAAVQARHLLELCVEILVQDPA